MPWPTAGEWLDWMFGTEDVFSSLGNFSFEDVYNTMSKAGNWLWNDGLDMAANFFAGFGDVLTCGLTDRYRRAIGADSFTDKNSGMYTAGQVVGTGVSIATAAANPCGAGAAMGTAIRGLNAVQAVGNGWNMVENAANHNYGSAAMDALGLFGNLMQLSRACFAAGTPLLTPEGSKPIEQFQVGDLLLSSPEDDPNGPIEPRRVEEVFQRSAPLLHLQVRGMRISTTGEHPFYAKDKGWTKAALLQPGDLLRSHDGKWISLDSIEATDEEATVYNLRIEEYHTYFVGNRVWGFSVWAHNTYTPVNRNRAASRAPNVGYVLFDKVTGEIYKFGISAGKLTKAGDAYRALRQLSYWNSKGMNLTSIVLRDFGNRARALKWEKDVVGFFRKLGHDLPGNIRPKGNPF